ncbi:GNAT family N-acetyltransferase [Pseudomonas sp. NPDC087346]|uniref:GNAT family N-acetyltransferase n=1 Tax=Pseudomonas sp. NPDC087346 TaxID=3364438 RepID=UPI0038297384
MDNLTLRRYRVSDASAVSALFRRIYGDHYAQPHVYLPCMFSQNHKEGRWHSLVAVDNQQIRGHATLFRELSRSASKGTRTAELALSVVDPDTRGQNIATRLGQKLLIHAQALDCHSVTIKQVTQHPYTQRMASSLGFHSTGLLPDYVASPFGELNRETVVLGFQSIDGYQRPLPALVWPEDCRELMHYLSAAFGTEETQPAWKHPRMSFDHSSGRYDVNIKELDASLLDQLRQLPAHWLISLRLRLAKGFTDAMQQLSTLGFAFTGVAPDDRSEGWLALFHRGYGARKLTLHCPHMQRLHDRAQQQAGLIEG